MQIFMALMSVNLGFSIVEDSISSQKDNMIHLLNISPLLSSDFLVLTRWTHVQSSHSNKD